MRQIRTLLITCGEAGRHEGVDSKLYHNQTSWTAVSCLLYFFLNSPTEFLGVGACFRPTIGDTVTGPQFNAVACPALVATLIDIQTSLRSQQPPFFLARLNGIPWSGLPRGNDLDRRVTQKLGNNRCYMECALARTTSPINPKMARFNIADFSHGVGSLLLIAESHKNPLRDIGNSDTGCRVCFMTSG